MKSDQALFAAALALAALSICPPQRTAAQEPALRRDVPPPVARDCAMPVPERRRTTAVAQDPAESARLVAAAREAALLGDARAAGDLLRRAARLDTGAANVAFLLARSLEELGFSDEAADEYCRYLRLAPDAPDAADVRQRVARIASPVRVGIPDSAVTRFHEALEAADSGRIADAQLAFSAVIEAAPAWAAPYYNRGVLHVRLDQRDAARADFERFVELEPDAAEDTAVSEWLARLATPFRPYSAGAAFAYGLIPGAGHFYTGRPVAGTFLLAVAGGAAAFGALYTKTEVDCLSVPQNGVCPPDQILSERTERPYLLHAIGAAAAATLFGAIDAARGARRHNERGAVFGATTSAGPAVRVRHARVDLELLRLRF